MVLRMLSASKNCAKRFFYHSYARRVPHWCARSCARHSLPGDAGPFSTDNNSVAAGAMALLNLFSGGALSYVSVFSLGIMPYITSSIILQMLQAVVPSCMSLPARARSVRPRLRSIRVTSPWLWQSSTPWVTSSSLRASASASMAPAPRDHLRPHDRRYAHRGRHADHVDW